MAKRFCYDIKDASGNYYKVVDGVVAVQATPYYHYEGIENFNKQGVKHKRNMERGGFITTYMDEDYQLVGDLRTIAKFILFTYGPDAVATLVVYKLSNYKTKEYSIVYQSEIDFGTAMCMRDQLTAQLMQGGISDMMATRSNTKYEIPLTSGNTKQVKVLPFRQYGRVRWISKALPTGDIVGRNASLYYNVLDEVQTTEAISPEADTFSVRPLFTVNENIELVNISGEVYFNIANATGGSEDYEIRLTSPAGSVLLYSVTLAGGANTNGNITINQNIANLTGGTGAVFLTFISSHVRKPTSSSSPNWDFTMEGGRKLTVTYQYFSSEFTVKGISLFDAAKELVNKMTDGLGTFASNLLSQDISYKDGIDCKPANIILLSGDTIRGLTDTKLKISWQDLVKALDMWFCAGWDVFPSVNNVGAPIQKVVIERRKDFFNAAVQIADLGESTGEWSISHADDLAYNELHIGYPDFEYDNVNGKEEFNTRLRMLTGQKRTMNGTNESSNIKEVISPIRADTFGIYSTWVKYSQAGGTDSQSDNNIFCIQHSPNNTAGVYTALYANEINPSITPTDVRGLTDSNRALNIGLSPKRCLIRRVGWEISHFYDSNFFTDVYTLKYLTVEKNPSLVSKITSTYFIGETSDVNMADMLLIYGDNRVFYPFYMETKQESPLGYTQAWEANRNGYFTAKIGGVSFNGFPVTGEERNAHPMVSTFKTLLTGDQNPQDFI